MTTKIEFTQQIQFGEKTITEIVVHPLLFAAFANLWTHVANEARGKKNENAQKLMQRRRIMQQTHFMVGTERVVPDAANISQLPIPVARAIIGALDNGEGVAGKLLNDGDGVTTPVHYQLGNPISLKMNNKDVKIEELEFKASTFGEIEDVLAMDGDVPQAMELLRRNATPVGLEVQSLPSWVLERLSVADGVTITNLVLPRFLA